MTLMPFNTLRTTSYYIMPLFSVVPARLQPLFITARAYAALPCRSRLRMTLLKDILKRRLKKYAKICFETLTHGFDNVNFEDIILK